MKEVNLCIRFFNDEFEVFKEYLELNQIVGTLCRSSEFLKDRGYNDSFKKLCDSRHEKILEVAEIINKKLSATEYCNLELIKEVEK